MQNILDLDSIDLFDLESVTKLSAFHFSITYASLDLCNLHKVSF